MNEKSLEGIVQLRGNFVQLEKIKNPRLRRALKSALNSRFQFWYSDSGYSEVKEDPVYDDKTHTDRHGDNYRDSHSDHHTDYDDYSESHSDEYGTKRDYGYRHEDRGYSEKYNQGHKDHSDFYS